MLSNHDEQSCQKHLWDTLQRKASWGQNIISPWMEDQCEYRDSQVRTQGLFSLLFLYYTVWSQNIFGICSQEVASQWKSLLLWGCHPQYWLFLGSYMHSCTLLMLCLKESGMLWQEKGVRMIASTSFLYLCKQRPCGGSTSWRRGHREKREGEVLCFSRWYGTGMGTAVLPAVWDTWIPIIVSCIYNSV